VDKIDGCAEAGRVRSQARARPRPGEPGWRGPEWDDPVLTRLARQLRDAHRLIVPLPADTRRRLIRHLLAITDLAKRDPALAARRLDAFLADFDKTSNGEPPVPRGAAPRGGDGSERERPADVE
jgi:hypothetical protein